MSTIPGPQAQKALLLDSNGGEFNVGSRAVDVPGPGEILVKVHAAGLNPADWKVQRFAGAMVKDEDYPVVLGFDGAGDVVSFGEGVQGFSKGDRVMFQSADVVSKYGSFQKYAIVREEAIGKIPNGITFDQAATVPLVLSTAYGGLYHANPHGMGLERNHGAKDTNYQGQAFVVLGGASGVGQMAIQLARLAGFSPIITTASPKHTSYLLGLGATHVLDRSLDAEAVKKAVKSILTNEGSGKELKLKYLYDAIGEDETHELGLGLLDEGVGAQLHSVAPPRGSLEPLSGGKRVNSFIAFLKEGEGLADNKTLFKEMYGLTLGWLERGDIKPTRVEVLPGGLEGIKRGIEKLEKGEVSGVKLIGHPQETD